MSFPASRAASSGGGTLPQVQISVTGVNSSGGSNSNSSNGVNKRRRDMLLTDTSVEAS